MRKITHTDTHTHKQLSKALELTFTKALQFKCFPSILGTHHCTKGSQGIPAPGVKEERENKVTNLGHNISQHVMSLCSVLPQDLVEHEVIKAPRVAEEVTVCLDDLRHFSHAGIHTGK